jgi:hypothetical protein
LAKTARALRELAGDQQINAKLGAEESPVLYRSLAKLGCSSGQVEKVPAQSVPFPDSAFILPHLHRIDRESGVHGGRGRKNDAAFGS